MSDPTLVAVAGNARLEALSPRARRLLLDMPGYYYGDEASLRVLDSLCRELDRLEAFLVAVRQGFFPTVADDTYGLLSMWERITGLQVAPVGVSVADRRAAVLANRRRRVDTADGWVSALNELLASGSWSHLEVAGRRVVITSTYAGVGWNLGTFMRFARKVTPAHLNLISANPGGFLLGVSVLGDAL